MSSPYFVHDSSLVDDGVEIGAGTRIWHFCHVMSGARIGENCSLGQNVFVGAGVSLGNGVKVQNNVSIYPGVVVEDDAFLGPSMVFTNVINPRSRVERKHEFRATLVRRGATVGANATVLCGITLGQYSFVGAGAVVTRSVPDFALVYGIPAKIRGWICACGQQLPFSHSGEEERAKCQFCDREYLKTAMLVELIQAHEDPPA